MKILVVSDEENNYIWDFFDKSKFCDIDMIISCGDLKASYLSYLVTMINAPLYYVHGNHDERYATHPPEGCISLEDQIINYKGIRIAGLGGSIEYSGGSQQFSPDKMMKRVKKLTKPSITMKPKKIDILVTHAPAKGLGDGDSFAHQGFPAFNWLLDTAKPKYHLHGHQHLSYGPNMERIIKYGDTTIINGFGYHIFEF
ncbi:MAG TPA: metallophosphoesterase [Epulopiscium sp.]|nr:metallophosphoesterase [Candidatus Epulonipiscium sp.]